MPNFWPGAVSADAVPHPEGMKPEQVVAGHRKVREQEVAQIAAYLWTSSERSKLVVSSAPKGDAAKGKQIFDSVGCRGCHVVEQGSAARRSEGSAERDYAPNLWNVGDKAKPEWIYSWVKNPKALWPQTKMPDLRLTDQEAANVTAFLLTLHSDQKYADPPEYAPGQEKAPAALRAAGLIPALERAGLSVADRGDLPTIRVGRHRRVIVAALEQRIADAAAAS